MKKLTVQSLSGLYAIILCPLLLLAVSPAGYLNIADTKYAVFAVLTGLYCAISAILLIRDRKTALPRLGVTQVLVILFWAWSLLSALCSPWRGIALLGGDRFDGMLTITLYCAVFLLVSMFGKPNRNVIWPVAVALALCSIVAVLQFFDLNPLRLFPGELRWSGREVRYNGAFLSLVGNADITASVFSVGFAVMWTYGLLRRKPVFLLLAAFLLGVIVCSGIRGGMLASAGGLLLTAPLLLPLKRRGKTLVYCGIALAIGATVLALYLYPMGGTAGELHRLLHGEVDDSFATGRFYIWRHVWTLIKERPLLGGGADTLGQRGLAFVKSEADGSVLRRTIDTAHNEYLNTAVNQGIPALLFGLGALGITLFRALLAKTTAAAILRTAVVTYCLGAVVGISTPANAPFLWLCWALLEAELRQSPAPSTCP